MPYYEKSEDWLHQSTLLLQARPATTRITTRYHIKPARRVPKAAKANKSEESAEGTLPDAAAAAAKDDAKDSVVKPPRGHLVLKTYDPASGVTLKYKTSKAAEVSRLVQMLGTLGRGMAALPPTLEKKQEDVEMVDAEAAAETGGQQQGWSEEEEEGEEVIYFRGWKGDHLYKARVEGGNYEKRK
ncbi:signal recognition particle 9 kDa protein-domain-containing protein [Cladorrhinum sp. PSN259]|nr:signal recognition particle 9 kDa protein-domain-containing protein [Cladorrhinum sp. PSN259]